MEDMLWKFTTISLIFIDVSKGCKERIIISQSDFQVCRWNPNGITIQMKPLQHNICIVLLILFYFFEEKEEIYFFGKFFTLVIIRRERIKNEHYTFAFKLKCQKCMH